MANTEDQAELSNATFAKLSESIIQQNALSISSVVVPEFYGRPNEDVNDFLKKFKLATLGFSNTHKCLLINRALKGSALTWAQEFTTDLLADSEWQQVEAKLIERFGPIDKKLYYLEKMKRSMFEPDLTTLISYVEGYLALYKKAYPVYQVVDAIYSLRCNLPDQIIKGLNSMDDNWINYDRIDTLLALVCRFERNILSFEKKDTSQTQTVSPDALKTMLEELKDKFTEEIKSSKDTNDKSKGLAVITHQTPSKPIDESKFQFSQLRQNNSRPDSKRRYNGSNNRPNYNYRPNNNYRPNYNNNNPGSPSNKRPRKDESNSRSSSAEPSKQPEDFQQRLSQRQRERVDAYYAKYGDSLRECRYCKGKHLNRHCPLLKEDLK